MEKPKRVTKSKKALQDWTDIKDELNKLIITNAKPLVFSELKSRSIDEEIQSQELRERQIKNDALEQDVQLKKTTLDTLFRFLGAETTLIFCIVLIQGFGSLNFKIDEWSFRILLVGTILQITAMLTIAVRHLFPSK